MQIAENTVVSFDYTLRNNDGETLDTSEGREPLTYLHGHGNIIPGLEKAMTGRDEGDSFSVTVPPEDAYGQHREELVQNVPRSAFQGVEQLEPGMQFQAESNAGPMVVTVKEVGDDEVTVDGNHVLAGQELQFEVEVKTVRGASDEEIEHGHVHDGSTHE
ncbi:FKBP-type peptidylprolyl isomerase [Salinisphaera sp. PC39]|uniref:peptidylprolyl isomerase n=1 Tax=Salinisphaera sp. PC39 TaxID=1304156 RepID=UPI003342C270